MANEIAGEAKGLSDAIDMAHDLIQEAKGADGPIGGFVTDHLDAAENWLDIVGEVAFELYTALVWAEAAIAPFSREPAEKSGINMVRAALAKARGQ